MATRISNAQAIKRCDVHVKSFDQAPEPGFVVIFTDDQPEYGDSPPTGAALVQIPLERKAFSDPVDTNPGCRATLNGMPSARAFAAGKPGWFRAYDGDYNPIQDGRVTGVGGGGEMEIDTDFIKIDAIVTITNWFIDEVETGE